ncbi:ribonuclease HI [Rubellicoccus peritrichatus]|uniref:RNase H family protein n=1 Tax=Rubellicoccus peritrichatus TaxID=3080537 RepID=A0AAQ3LCS9_9BACT|nr:RNase H family protein [Puniceicoccus sp. CR14]WOO43017.1 RNase H family protein [Puniceicoccus sp. CR14]
MNNLILFSDGSVNTQRKIGYGAYFVVNDLSLNPADAEIKLKRFEHTSSTKLELQTLLWALKEIKPLTSSVTVYTDSQNIVGLPGRRHRLEQNNYYSKNNKRLNNYELYQEFFNMIDQVDCNFLKVTGHLPSKLKNRIDRLFSLVDKASRNALRANKTSSSGSAKF